MRSLACAGPRPVECGPTTEVYLLSTTFESSASTVAVHSEREPLRATSSDSHHRYGNMKGLARSALRGRRSAAFQIRKYDRPPTSTDLSTVGTKASDHRLPTKSGNTEQNIDFDPPPTTLNFSLFRPLPETRTMGLRTSKDLSAVGTKAGDHRLPTKSTNFDPP
ncbi:hypothetical protein C8R44DRAFT_868743 [Mycena epipterygia]|nr:hypothetical protein C8R44DRAFT_868743 [Mycena epipterygia]